MNQNHLRLNRREISAIGAYDALVNRAVDPGFLAAAFDAPVRELRALVETTARQLQFRASGTKRWVVDGAVDNAAPHQDASGDTLTQNATGLHKRLDLSVVGGWMSLLTQRELVEIAETRAYLRAFGNSVTCVTHSQGDSYHG